MLKKLSIRFLFLCFLFFSTTSQAQVTETTGEKRPSLSFHPHGPVGLFRLYSAEMIPSGPAAFGFGISTEYLLLNDFPSAGTDIEKLAGRASASWTPFQHVELFLSGSAFSSNEGSSTSLIQQVGNANFGAKVAGYLSEYFSLGVLYEGDLRRPLYDKGLTERALSHTGYLVGTIGFDIPLKIYMNAGYRLDDTEKLFYTGITERDLILMESLGKDAIVGGLGLEVPLSSVNLSLEYSTEQSLKTAGIGYLDNPQRLTAGVRYFPRSYPNVSVGIAGNVGMFATRNATRVYKEPDYSFMGALTYALGRVEPREVVKQVAPAASKTSIIIGKISDAKTGKPIGNARITLCNSSISPLVSDADSGIFRSYPVPEGDCEIKVVHADFETYSNKLIVSGQETTQDIVLQRVSASQGVLILQVKDTDDKPVQAQIAFPEIPSAQIVSTNDQGKIRMKLPEGKYLVEVRAAGRKSEQKIFEIVGNAEMNGEYILASGSAKLEDQRIVITRQIQFAPGRMEIQEDSKMVLDEVVSILNQHAEIKKLEVGGHTDATGSVGINKKLSFRRAQAVVNYLVSAGVARSRLTSVGYGPEKPIASNATPEGRVANRRVEFRVVSK